MNKNSHEKAQSRRSPRSMRPKLFVGLICLAVGAAVLTGVVLTDPGHSSMLNEQTVSPAPVGGEERPELNRLISDWVRPGGGYVIRISNVSAGGQVQAAYFNPRPIAVARADASFEGDALRLLVELQDIGYPGSTYDLSYEPVSDSLKGAYFQAQVQQLYEVTFVRAR